MQRLKDARIEMAELAREKRQLQEQLFRVNMRRMHLAIKITMLAHRGDDDAVDDDAARAAKMQEDHYRNAPK